MINSSGASGKDDLAQAVRTAVINKRAGGMGLISGRKAFQKPMKDDVELLNTIQVVYLESKITIAYLSQGTSSVSRRSIRRDAQTLPGPCYKSLWVR